MWCNTRMQRLTELGVYKSLAKSTTCDCLKRQHRFSVFVLLLIINASRDQPWNLWRRATYSCQLNPIYHGCTCDGPVSVISFDIVESITRKALSRCLTSKISCMCWKGQPAERISHQFITTCLQLQLIPSFIHSFMWFVINWFNHYSTAIILFSHVDHSFSNGFWGATRYWNGHSYCVVKRYYLAASHLAYISTVCVLLHHSNVFIAMYYMLPIFSLSVLPSPLHQAQMLLQLTSSVWLWPGTEWILLAITSLFTDTIYQWVVLTSE